MPTSNLAILDTSVYIENFRTGRITCDRTDFTDLERYVAVTVLDWSEGAGVRLS